MFALHIELLCHLIAIIGKKIVIERLIITCNTATNASSMCSKYSSNFWQIFIHIEHAKTGHPFISMINNLLTLAHNMLIETFYNQCSSIREHGCLIIITISMKTIHLIIIPKLAIDLVFLFKIRLEIYQDCHRLARDLPSTYLYIQALFKSFCFPLRIKRIILREIRIYLLSPTIRTNKYESVL